ncbi:MAG TPA: DUF455 family protein [Dehalococcoidia bacterium]|nr:DUF455 family protein [Dehalococcoidia bacterium]
MSKLHERMVQREALREPPYRQIETISQQERQELIRKIGGVENYNLEVLTLLVEKHPENEEYKRALLSLVLSAEFRGLDAFGRFVCQWHHQGVPWEMTLAMSRQMWDETRHAQLNMKLLEKSGGKLGEYPDILGRNPNQEDMTEEEIERAQNIDPVQAMATIQVGLEGIALSRFMETHLLGGKIGDEALEQAHDYNWADEVTHVANGDYWIKELCKEDPEREAKALNAQAFFEMAMALQREALPEE